MLAKSLVSHMKKKRIDVKYHFIGDVLEDKHMELVKVQIDHNPTIILPKV